MNAASSTRVGPYQLLARIGQGGMGTVHLAKMDGPSGFRKLAVVKELRPDQINSPELVQLFLAEARLAARLTHPNVVHTYGADEDHGRLYIAMEYLDGQPWVRVRHRLWQSRSLPLATHLRVLAETLAALHYAHEASDYDGTPLSVVHCDVSPHNVFVTYEGQVKILDFGVARAATTKGITRKDSFAGKLSYAAPEQLSGEELDRRVDIFAVGVMLWEALAGRPFVDMIDRGAVLRRRIMGNEPRVREVVPTVPRALADMCDRATACSREERFTTAAEFRHALVDYISKNAPDTDDAQLARLVSTAFREERAQVRASIEGYLRTAPPPPPPPARSTLPPRAPTSPSRPAPAPAPASAAGSANGVHNELPSLPVLPTASIAPSSTSSSHISHTTITPIAPPPTRAQIPDLSQLGMPEAAGIGENTMRADLSELASVSKITDDRALVEASFAASVRPHDAVRQKPVLLAAAALGVLLVGWLLVSMISSSDDAQAGQKPGANEANDRVLLEINVQPKETELLLDGVKLGSNPFKGFQPRDSRQHEVRAVAPGRKPQQWMVRFDSDTHIVYQLPPNAPEALTAAPAQPAVEGEELPRTATPPVAAADEAVPATRSSTPARKKSRSSGSGAARSAAEAPAQATPSTAQPPAASEPTEEPAVAKPATREPANSRGKRDAKGAEPALDDRLEPEQRGPRTIYEEDPYK